MLLVCVLLSSSFALAADFGATLVIAANSERQAFKDFATASGVKIEVTTYPDMMETISTAYAIQDDRVDVYVFTAYSGLYLIKEKNFYTTMNNSAVLMAEYDKLYAPLQRALLDEGNVVGWLLNVQPIAMDNSSVLEAWGIPMPQTFSELMDVCKYIHENDLLEDKYTMFYSDDYTQKQMLALYMRWYISAYYLQGEVPDFTSDTFLNMVQRIKTEVPEAATVPYSDEKAWVLGFDWAATYIFTEMLPLPRVLKDQNNAVETYATVAIINPFSKNQEAAKALLEYCAQHPTNIAQQYVCDSIMTEPLVNEKVMPTLNAFRRELEKYKQAETLTQEEKDRMVQLEEVLIPQYEQKCYWIDEEDIAYYREFAQNLLVNEGSPVSYDQQLRQYAGQYLNGLMTLEEFSQKCQSHIERIFKELQ